jgi:outer membrane protein assembly factor BamA
MQLHGPNNFRDSLGGDTKTTFLAMLSVPVPINFLANAGMRAFCFFNAGSVGNPDYWKTQFYEKNT